MNSCTQWRKRTPKNHHSVLNILVWIHLGKLGYFLAGQGEPAGVPGEPAGVPGAPSPTTSLNQISNVSSHLARKPANQSSALVLPKYKCKEASISSKHWKPWSVFAHLLGNYATITVAETLLPDHSADFCFCSRPFIKYRWSYCLQCFWSFSVM